MNSELDLQNEIKLVVDYTKTLEQAIADGKYDKKNENINDKNFPVSPKMIGKKIEVSAKIFPFNCQTSSEDVIFEMSKVGYRPATLMELLVLGCLYPELQRQFTIIALGSIQLTYTDFKSVAHYRFVPCLYLGLFSKRQLCLRSFDSSTDVNERYLGILIS